MYAAEKGDTGCLKELLLKGVDLEAKDKTER